MVPIWCSIPIRIALSFSGAYPSPISFVGRFIASVGKLGVSSNAFLAAFSSILSIDSSCVSGNIPKCVAWYLDFSSWSITSCFLLGDRRRLVYTLAICLIFVVMFLRCSMKSNMGLICTLGILYDLFGDGYLMVVPFSNLIVLIWFIIRLVLALFNYMLPYP